MGSLGCSVQAIYRSVFLLVLLVAPSPHVYGVRLKWRSRNRGMPTERGNRGAEEDNQIEFGVEPPQQLNRPPSHGLFAPRQPGPLVGDDTGGIPHARSPGGRLADLGRSFGARGGGPNPADDGRGVGFEQQRAEAEAEHLFSQPLTSRFSSHRAPAFASRPSTPPERAPNPPALAMGPHPPAFTPQEEQPRTRQPTGLSLPAGPSRAADSPFVPAVPDTFPSADRIVGRGRAPSQEASPFDTRHGMDLESVHIPGVPKARTTPSSGAPGSPANTPLAQQPKGSHVGISIPPQQQGQVPSSPPAAAAPPADPVPAAPAPMHAEPPPLSSDSKSAIPVPESVTTSASAAPSDVLSDSMKTDRPVVVIHKVLPLGVPSLPRLPDVGEAFNQHLEDARRGSVPVSEDGSKRLILPDDPVASDMGSQHMSVLDPSRLARPGDVMDVPESLRDYVSGSRATNEEVTLGAPSIGEVKGHASTASNASPTAAPAPAQASASASASAPASQAPPSQGKSVVTKHTRQGDVTQTHSTAGYSLSKDGVERPDGPKWYLSHPYGDKYQDADPLSANAPRDLRDDSDTRGGGGDGGGGVHGGEGRRGQDHEQKLRAMRAEMEHMDRQLRQRGHHVASRHHRHRQYADAARPGSGNGNEGSADDEYPDADVAASDPNARTRGLNVDGMDLSGFYHTSAGPGQGLATRMSREKLEHMIEDIENGVTSRPGKGNIPTDQLEAAAARREQEQEQQEQQSGLQEARIVHDFNED